MNEPVGVGEGLAVVHLFCARTPGSDDAAVLSAVKQATEAGGQVVTVAVLGHKAQLCFMGLHSDAWVLRDLQTGLVRAGIEAVDSYVSITELSEYALGLPAEMAEMRLRPKLPPPNKPAWCFYPMTKRRNVGQNWYELPIRRAQGAHVRARGLGTQFRGAHRATRHRVHRARRLEWGVTLFGEDLRALKETVYTMRYDRASAAYAEFGSFVTGLVGPTAEILERTR